jgi:hypothetical protein
MRRRNARAFAVIDNGRGSPHEGVFSMKSRFLFPVTLTRHAVVW